MLYGNITELITEMASFRLKGNGWEAAVCIKGHPRKSKTFSTKREASFWAAEVEKEILAGNRGDIPDKTFGELLARYGAEVSPKKRGCDWELKRITALSRDKITSVMLCDLKADDFASWRDRRLKTVTAGTVLRDWNLLSHAINTAINEWEWLKINPMSRVKRPSQPLPRDRLISDDELDRLLLALGYDYDIQLNTVSSRVGAALVFAIETAMRASEITGLAWGNVDLDKRTARLVETKNGSKRDVPLSTEALRILRQLKTESGSVFQLNSSQIDALFRRAKKMAMIDGLHFHDSRATAITNLAKKLDILDLARMSGHRDLKMLQVYYRESAEDIAKKLN